MIVWNLPKHFDDKKILMQFKQYKHWIITNHLQHFRDIISKINLRLVYHIKLNIFSISIIFHNYKIMDNIQKRKTNNMNLILVSLTI